MEKQITKSFVIINGIINFIMILAVGAFFGAMAEFALTYEKVSKLIPFWGKYVFVAFLGIIYLVFMWNIIYEYRVSIGREDEK